MKSNIDIDITAWIDGAEVNINNINNSMEKWNMDRMILTIPEAEEMVIALTHAVKTAKECNLIAEATIQAGLKSALVRQTL